MPGIDVIIHELSALLVGIDLGIMIGAYASRKWGPAPERTATAFFYNAAATSALWWVTR